MYKLYWAQSSGVIAPQVLLEEIGAKYEKSRFGARPERRAVYLQEAQQLQRRAGSASPTSA